MATTPEISTRELRTHLSEALGRTQYAHERIKITRHGKVAAVLVTEDDLETLEQLELAHDTKAFLAAKAQDDGQRFSLEQIRQELA